MLCDSFIKVKNVTIWPGFPHSHSSTSLEMVLINLRGPALPFEYDPWFKAPISFGS